jgi:hypothetical protein
LNSLGFDWNPHETVWNEQYQKLMNYKKRFGDCLVPVQWKDDPSLGKWVHTQRVSRERLSVAKREALNSLSFDWDPCETIWNKHYQKPVAYQRNHGNCKVPSHWEGDLFLANWVHKQRVAKASLPEARRNDLEAIGFDWVPFETTWDANYQKTYCL